MNGSKNTNPFGKYEIPLCIQRMWRNVGDWCVSRFRVSREEGFLCTLVQQRNNNDSRGLLLLNRLVFFTQRRTGCNTNSNLQLGQREQEHLCGKQAHRGGEEVGVWSMGRADTSSWSETTFTAPHDFFDAATLYVQQADQHVVHCSWQMGQNQAGFQLGFGNHELLLMWKCMATNERSNLSNEEEFVHLDGVEETDRVVAVL